MTDANKWAGVVDKVLGWLKTVVPITVIMAMHRYLKGKIWRAERETEKKQMEIAHYENEEKVRKANADKSDSDIIRDAVDAGKRLRDGK